MRGSESALFRPFPSYHLIHILSYPLEVAILGTEGSDNNAPESRLGASRPTIHIQKCQIYASKMDDLNAPTTPDTEYSAPCSPKQMDQLLKDTRSAARQKLAGLSLKDKVC